ncbi:MAG TPA: N,N-dimethylformamidase beta subunit family domain-containing protein [Baekduia sp.]|uniref:N,N-dimethylformamidase beta subunit family domain-containing protein n=1 Tax=Baekduia sp. TaxID=2600305 RepID=UPI002D7A184A|nr:N,N-dimethylformamidase beta subunit family domain-containing protein [Baekduia sp.]HET6507842.1 N,N-dimethylformamidase beta subunit family domain-containing protein [Baekduia sp.]
MRGISTGPQWPHWYQWIRGERPGDDPSRLEVWGYAGRPSYAPGETLTLHVSTTASTFDVLVYRDGAEREVVHRATGLPGTVHPTPEDAYASGCRWPASVSVEIPGTWRSGGYVVELTVADERGTATQDGFFAVRPAAPSAPIAVVLATYTWQAYNDWGGGSAYSRDRAPAAADDPGAAGHAAESSSQRSADGFSPRLSFDRPWARGLIRRPLGAPRVAMGATAPPGWALRREQGEWSIANGYSYWSGAAGWDDFDAPFVRWAERQGYAIDVLTQWDLDRDPDCIKAYNCVVTVGHDEYWTATGRRALDTYVEQGGRYARFAGNILWRIRLEDEGTAQVCFKYVPELDPAAGTGDRATGAFESRAIGDPPVTTFGANGGRGIYSRMGGSSPRGVGGFIVYRPGHWVFAGTDLYYADVLGGTVPLVGYESDGVGYTFDKGLPVPTGEDGAPASLEILALTPGGMAEEDHGNPGAFVEIGEGDMRFLAETIHGADTPETRDASRHGCAVITWMSKGAGEVVCAGSTEWPHALAQAEPTAERVVRNVLDRFSAR